MIMLENLTPAPARAFMIADNRLTEIASWDEKLLGEHFKALAEVELDFTLEAIGFEMGEIDVFIEGLAPATEDGQDPADSIPDRIASGQVSQLGDLWVLGKHRVLCGNALDSGSYAKLMGGQRAGVVFADPPYNVPIDGHATGLGKIHHSDFPMACRRVPTARLKQQGGIHSLRLYGLAAYVGAARSRPPGLSGAEEPLRMGQGQRRHGLPLSQPA